MGALRVLAAELGAAGHAVAEVAEVAEALDRRGN
jgi:hypothetical protein